MFGGRSPLCLSLQRRLLAYCPSGRHWFLLGVLLLVERLLLLWQALVRLHHLHRLLHHRLHHLHEQLVVLVVAEGLVVAAGPAGPVRFHQLVRLWLLPWSFMGVLVIAVVWLALSAVFLWSQYILLATLQGLQQVTLLLGSVLCPCLWSSLSLWSFLQSFLILRQGFLLALACGSGLLQSLIHILLGR